MAASRTPTLVLVPEWGTGHLMSMLESCKRILLCGGRAFSITLLVMRPPTAQATSEVEAHVRREAASGLDIRFHRLPAVQPPADAAGVEEFIARYIQLHAPHVRDAVAGMPCPVAALVLDLFAAPMVDVARDLGVPSYVFMSSTGAMLALMLHLPVLHQVVTVEFSQVDGESLWHGLPMAPWPLYAEQHLNAFELVADMGVAVPLKVDRKRDNLVEAADLERAVKCLMGEEGRKARERAAEMRDVCRNAVSKGGSSDAALQRLSEALHHGAVLPPTM
ncbi:unnamed protein product [Triticum turgidum subsp. durum]|uniref:Glycosyltransferase n=1 Tax=Triticum turgidum subsp. durum TaxID=4567 RepID=A0A9R0TFE3_TRITD|nr:unnamed protein product [Triticum turgidum subsp. durum]